MHIPSSSTETCINLPGNVFIEIKTCAGARHLETPIRRLDGITYWVIKDPDAIYDFINNEIRKEWEEDARDEGREPREDTWLNTLPRRKWSLQTVEINHVKLDPRIMNCVDVKTGYNFKESLAKRSLELKETIERFATVIWPMVVKKEDSLLVDGYCRYAALKAMRVPRVYAYVGTL